MPDSNRWGIEIKHVILATLGISLLAVLIILSVNWARRPADNETVGSVPVRNEWAGADRLRPADDFSGPLELEWIPYRPRETRWNEERVEEHWIDPATVGRDVLDERVEGRIDDILEGVP